MKKHLEWLACRAAPLIVAAVSLGLTAVPVHAQISTAVLKCEDTTNKTLGKFVGSKAKCVMKCLATQRKAASPNFASCLPPYADPTESACITGSLKGAEAKAGAGIAKACAALASCPSCYTPATKCTDASGANPWVQSTETTLDGLVPLIYCRENGNTNPSTTDAKCEDGITKALTKFVGAKGKCYQKCNDNLNKGKAAAGSCTPPATDPATVTCISTAESKSSASIDKACPTMVSCSVFPNGAGWTGVAETGVDGQTPQIYCAGTTTSTTTTTTSSTTTTSTPPGPTLTIMNTAGTADCGGAGLPPIHPPSPPLSGEIDSDTAATTKISDLGLGCLYIGGGNNISTPASRIPDGSSSIFAVSGTGSTRNLLVNTGTGPADCTVGAGPGKSCIGPTNTGAPCASDADCDVTRPGSCALDANCFFGPPLPVPNGGLSTCVVNAILTDASGTVTPSTGDAVININLSSRVFLTGNATSPCPKCVSGTCNAGPNVGLACTPVGSQLTTLDCPPLPGGFLAPLPVNLAPLVTTTTTAVGAGGNFCTGQANPGAFGQAATQAIKQNGSPGGDLSDGNPHAAVLGYSFCVPKTNNAAVDGSADLPGPGSVGLPIDMQLASPSGAFPAMP
jgi:hypothetical protein